MNTAYLTRIVTATLTIILCTVHAFGAELTRVEIAQNLATAFSDQIAHGTSDVNEFLNSKGFDEGPLADEVRNIIDAKALLSQYHIEVASSRSRSRAESWQQLSPSRRKALLSLNPVPAPTGDSPLLKAANARARADAEDNGPEEIMKKAPSFDPAEIRMRNAGISFSSGFGIARSGGTDHSILTGIARWNWIQKKSAARWNSLVAQDSKDKVEYALVPYFGEYYYWDSTDHGTITGDYVAWSGSRFFPTLTSFGPFIGTSLDGEKITMGTKEVRPYLAGISAGFGFYDQAASLVYLEVGTTISPHNGFEDSDLYFGISVDAILLTKIMGIRNKPETETPQK